MLLHGTFQSAQNQPLRHHDIPEPPPMKTNLPPFNPQASSQSVPISAASEFASILNLKRPEDFPKNTTLDVGPEYLWSIDKGVAYELYEGVNIAWVGVGRLAGLSILNPDRDRAKVIVRTATRIIARRWTSDEVERACRTPYGAKAAIALLSARNADYLERIGEYQRVGRSRAAMAILRIDRSIGRDNETPLDGPRVISAGITHEMLSLDFGTSRELTTFWMNKFKRSGAIRYSRKDGIVIWPDRLRNEAAHE